MEQVLVCPVCAHINPVDAHRYCASCFGRLEDVAAVTPERGADQVRLRHLRFLRGRLVRLGLLLAAAIGFTVWGVLVFFELGPLPPGATTSVDVEQGPGILGAGPAYSRQQRIYCRPGPQTQVDKVDFCNFLSDT